MRRVICVAATAAALQAPLNKRPSTKVDVSTLEAPTERVVVPEDGSPMRPPILTPWDENKLILEEQLGFSQERLATYDDVTTDDLSDAYEMMQLCRQFENACNQAYMQGNIRGFMHLDNGQVRLLTLHSNKLRARYTLSRCSFFIRHRRRRSRRGLPTRSRRATSSIRTTASTPTRSRRASTPAR